jgi:hypothetical protein
MESLMVPLFAAASAVSDLASGARSLWTSLSAAAPAGGKKTAGSDSTGFAALLGSKGVDIGGRIRHAGDAVAGHVTPAAGVAQGLVNRLA